MTLTLNKALPNASITMEITITSEYSAALAGLDGAKLDDSSEEDSMMSTSPESRRFT